MSSLREIVFLLSLFFMIYPIIGQNQLVDINQRITPNDLIKNGREHILSSYAKFLQDNNREIIKSFTSEVEKAYSMYVGVKKSEITAEKQKIAAAIEDYNKQADNLNKEKENFNLQVREHEKEILQSQESFDNRKNSLIPLQYEYSNLVQQHYKALEQLQEINKTIKLNKNLLEKHDSLVGRIENTKAQFKQRSQSRQDEINAINREMGTLDDRKKNIVEDYKAIMQEYQNYLNNEVLNYNSHLKVLENYINDYNYFVGEMKKIRSQIMNAKSVKECEELKDGWNSYNSQIKNTEYLINDRKKIMQGISNEINRIKQEAKNEGYKIQNQVTPIQNEIHRLKNIANKIVNENNNDIKKVEDEIKNTLEEIQGIKILEGWVTCIRAIHLLGGCIQTEKQYGVQLRETEALYKSSLAAIEKDMKEASQRFSAKANELQRINSELTKKSTQMHQEKNALATFEKCHEYKSKKIIEDLNVLHNELFSLGQSFSELVRQSIFLEVKLIDVLAFQGGSTNEVRQQYQVNVIDKQSEICQKVVKLLGLSEFSYRYNPKLGEGIKKYLKDPHREKISLSPAAIVLKNNPDFVTPDMIGPGWKLDSKEELENFLLIWTVLTLTKTWSPIFAASKEEVSCYIAHGDFVSFLLTFIYQGQQWPLVITSYKANSETKLTIEVKIKQASDGVRFYMDNTGSLNPYLGIIANGTVLDEIAYEGLLKTSINTGEGKKIRKLINDIKGVWPNENTLAGREFLLLGLAFSLEADAKPTYFEEMFFVANSFYEKAKIVTQFTVDTVPGIGIISSVYQLITGKSLITQQPADEISQIIDTASVFEELKKFKKSSVKDTASVFEELKKFKKPSVKGIKLIGKALPTVSLVNDFLDLTKGWKSVNNRLMAWQKHTEIFNQLKEPSLVVDKIVSYANGQSKLVFNEISSVASRERIIEQIPAETNVSIDIRNVLENGEVSAIDSVNKIIKVSHKDCIVNLKWDANGLKYHDHFFPGSFQERTQ